MCVGVRMGVALLYVDVSVSVCVSVSMGVVLLCGRECVSAHY